MSLRPIAWEVLFGDRLEQTPDVNKPENQVYVNAVRKQRDDAIRHFAVGAGKALYDEWKNKVRGDMIALLMVPKAQFCNCTACMILREIRPRLEMILEAEVLMAKEEK